MRVVEAASEIGGLLKMGFLILAIYGAAMCTVLKVLKNGGSGS